MKPDTIVKLGDFEFSGYEVPESIPFGGSQNLVLHQLVGGRRVIDDMGPSYANIQWSGLLYGQNALSRARYLETLRTQGGTLKLTWSELSYNVVIAEVKCNFERFYQIPYTITLMVQDNLTLPQNVVVGGIDSYVADDMATANTLGTQIGDSTLSTLLSTLDTAIKAVSSFATAAQSTINSVLQPLHEVQARVTILTSQVSSVLENTVTIGGLLPNTTLSQRINGLINQTSAMEQWPPLAQLQAVTGRMNANLQSIGGSGKSVTVAGGDLYHIAEQQYNDATAWTGIARANGLTDPQIQGIKTITIPTNPDNSGGILSA